MIHDPHNIIYDPHHIIYDPHHIIYDPHHIIYDPHYMIYDPHHIMYDPHHMIYDPHHIIYATWELSAVPDDNCRSGSRVQHIPVFYWGQGLGVRCRGEGLGFNDWGFQFLLSKQKVSDPQYTILHGTARW